MGSLKEHIAWLSDEVKSWVKDGLLSEQQAGAIIARYPARGAGLPWGMIIFSTIGAVVAGLGVILLFAYNWNVIPKFVKLAVIFGVIIASHAAGIRLYLGGGRFKGLGEGLCMLGTMLFGAGIWLVAQVYHIDEHFPNGIMLWGMGALLMALAMRSSPQGALAAILLTVWSGVELAEFHTPVVSASLLILFTLCPLAWFKKSRFLLAVVIPALVASMMFPLLNHYSHPWFILAMFLNISAALVGLSILVRYAGGFPQSSGIFGFFGWTIFVIFLFLGSIPALCHEFFGHHHWDSYPGGLRQAYLLAPLVLCIAAWAGVLYHRHASPRHPADAMGMEIYLIPLCVILAYSDMFLFSGFQEDWIFAGPFNLAFLALSFALMVRGCREGLLKPTVFGSIMLVALMIARYFDLFESLVVRGIVFLVIGGGIFYEGLMFSRAKKRKTTAETK